MAAGDPNLFVPAAHVGALGVSVGRFLLAAGVPVGLREIEVISDVAWIKLQRLHQQANVPLKLVHAIRAAGVILVP